MSNTAKILVVDDDNFMQEIFAEALGDTYQVIPLDSRRAEGNAEHAPAVSVQSFMARLHASRE